jgi:selenocysteine lyase/cysteine desulfurase
VTLTVDALRSTPNALARYYSRFDVASRLLLTGHSHQAWPDVAEDGILRCFADAAEAVDDKWERAEAMADRVRAGYRALLEDPDGQIALGPNTHDLVIKLLSVIDLEARPRVVTTDSEFHSLRRQLARFAEDGLDVVRVPADPVATLAERVAAELDGRTALVAVSAVLFTTSEIVPHLDALATACERAGIELLVDAYHALGAIPFPIHERGLTNAWVTGGGYKYLQLGEGNAFLRLPPGAHDIRPAITGWFAEFETLFDPHDLSYVGYGRPETRFASGTYDPTSNYRAAAVFDFFDEHGLQPAFLREVSLHQVGVIRSEFDALDLPDTVVTRDRSTQPDDVAGFLTLQSPVARELQRALGARGVLTDSRGEILRLGPAPYLTDAQLMGAVSVLGEVASAH